jgi:acetyl-CoA carboxylase biotin carboxyl carrier protein
MSSEKLTYQDLLQIVELVKASSQFAEFHLKVGDVEVDLKRAPVDAANATNAAASTHATAATSPNGSAANAAHATVIHPHARHLGGGEVVTEPASHLAESGAAIKHAPVAYPENAILIKSPMVGTFYRASEPGARPFVDIGQTVEPDATVCIIEVMKLMNSIPAGVRGVVTHIAVDDGEPVEYGQVLLAIEAA